MRRTHTQGCIVYLFLRVCEPLLGLGWRGNPGGNKIARARAIEKVLLENGIDGDRVSVGTGTNRNDDENRRVGIVIK